jgi:formate hydrogenlyase subunit 3/multisubunit Na+/H+ antiporter MnhD subunit
VSAPLLWIIVPAAWGIILWLLRRYQTLTLLLAAAMCFLLSLLALNLPIDQTIKLGGISFQLSSTLPVLGRRFALTANDGMILVLIYGTGTVWFGLSVYAWPNRNFASFGLAMLATLVAALAVEPFLYAALLVETAVLLSIPFLSLPGRTVGPGMQRYLIFQTLAVPVILLGGWELGLAEANPTATEMYIRAGLLLGLGFAFWLAIFPFYNWLPMMMTETHPFAAGFLLSLLPAAVLLVVLDFINATAFFRTSPALYDAARIVGIIMVFTAGIFAAFQVNLARLFGYAVIFETGFALLSISLHSLSGFMLFASALLPRSLALLVFALALSSLQNREIPLTLDGVKGLAYRFPFVSLGLLSSIFSIVGFPLFAGLPVKLEIFEQMAPISQTAIIGSGIGVAGFIFATMRVLLESVQGVEQSWQSNESWAERVLLGGGVLFLLLFGLFPAYFSQSILFILRAFPELF